MLAGDSAGSIDSSSDTGVSGGEWETAGGVSIGSSTLSPLEPVGTRFGREGDAEAGGDDGRARGGEAGTRGVAPCEPSIGDSDCSKFFVGDGPTVVPGRILGADPEAWSGATRGSTTDGDSGVAEETALAADGESMGMVETAAGAADGLEGRVLLKSRLVGLPAN